MAIINMNYVVYERLASAKMNTMVSEINGHTHNGTYGVQIPFSLLTGQIGATQIPTGSPIIDGSMIQNNSITTAHITNGTILFEDLDSLTSNPGAGTIKLIDGYAVYAP